MKKAYFSLLTMLLAFVAFAQESTDVKVDINGGGNSANWYTSPWVWIAGAAIFILLLVALLSGGRSRTNSSGEKVTVTKTVRRDVDTDL